MDITTKKRLRTLLFFTVFLLVMTMILAGFSLLAEKKWNEKLSVQVETVLEESRPLDFPKKYTVAEPVKINSLAAVSSNMYRIVPVSGNGGDLFALITRVTTFYGPQAAVFLYGADHRVSFEGFACLNSRVARYFENKDSDLAVRFWISQAAKIFENSVHSDGARYE